MDWELALEFAKLAKGLTSKEMRLLDCTINGGPPNDFALYTYRELSRVLEVWRGMLKLASQGPDQAAITETLEALEGELVGRRERF